MTEDRRQNPEVALARQVLESWLPPGWRIRDASVSAPLYEEIGGVVSHGPVDLLDVELGHESGTTCRLVLRVALTRPQVEWMQGLLMVAANAPANTRFDIEGRVEW